MDFSSLRVGQSYVLAPESFGDGERMIGKIIYIHPLKHFYTAEFELKNGEKIRESFNIPKKSQRKQRS